MDRFKITVTEEDGNTQASFSHKAYLSFRLQYYRQAKELRGRKRETALLLKYNETELKQQGCVLTGWVSSATAKHCNMHTHTQS